MEVEVSGAKPIGGEIDRSKSVKDQVRVKRKTLEAVLEQCQRTLQMISNTDCVDDDDKVSDDGAESDGDDDGTEGSLALCDRETDELCSLLKSRVECPDFLQKLETAQVSLPQSIIEEGSSSSWDMVNENDLWECEKSEVEEEEYVLVCQEDIVEGIACFMAAYLLSLKETKDLTPNQLQEALSKTFSLKKKKGKLRKAWDGSKVLYNVASWGATAIGIYQNPALLRVASSAFWTSCRVISKLL
jgi:hypothetical protein